MAMRTLFSVKYSAIFHFRADRDSWIVSSVHPRRAKPVTTYPSPVLNSIVQWTASRVFVLSLTFVMLNFAVALVALPGSLGAAYHPNVFYAPYAPPIAAIGAPMTVISLLMAIGFLVERRRASRSYLAVVFLRVLFAEAILFLLVLFFVKPVPTYFTQYIGTAPYRIQAHTHRDRTPYRTIDMG